MADFDESQFDDPMTAISQGKRHLLVQDYSSAVIALTRACEMLSNEYGDTGDELGEPFLLYGKALLFLAREESGILGTGVPGNEESTVDNDDDDDDDDEAGEDNDNELDNEKEIVTESDLKTNSNKTLIKSTADEVNETKDLPETNIEDGQKVKEKKKEIDSEPSTSCTNKVNDTPGTSTGKLTNGNNSKSCENGIKNDNDSDDKEDEDDEINNLQVAWEVLELAKLILLKRGPRGWKSLAETHRLLGEIAMESDNVPGALIDLNACLDLLNKIEPKEIRIIAEIHYQLGLAYSLINEFDASIEQFQKATALLEERIKELENMTEAPKSDNPFYTIENEIKELKELRPEIREKISDMQEYKEEACRMMIEGIKSKVADGNCSNGAGPSGVASSNVTSSVSSKPTTDISYLVRKKRKSDEIETPNLPQKKPTP